MRETAVRVNSIIPGFEGVNQLVSIGPRQLDEVDGTHPKQTGALIRIGGKEFMQQIDGPVLTIHQLYTAFGYSGRLTQGDDIVLDPEDPPDFEFKVPVIDYPVNCPKFKKFSNKLKRQNIDRRADYILLRYHWSKCDGSDFDSRTALVQCSIAGVPTFNGTVKEAIVGFFADGTVLDFTHNGKQILAQAQDNPRGFESVMVNIKSLKELAGTDVPLFAKFQLKGYWFSYVNFGNIQVNFHPRDARKNGTYQVTADGKDFGFKGGKALDKKSWKANITTQTTTPILTTGDHICYLYVSIASNPKKTVIWIDDA